jgi:hypothetical protein
LSKVADKCFLCRHVKGDNQLSIMEEVAYNVAMFVARIPNRKSRPTILLRESYREDGKVKSRTIANLTQWPPERITAMERLCKGEFDGLGSGVVTSGAIFGVLFALKHLADQVGLTRVLGPSPEGRLSLFLILARLAHGGSRLSAVRWAQQHAVGDVLGVEGFDEDDLYAALDWLADQQARIEQALYREHVKRHGKPPALVLYDVTSRPEDMERCESERVRRAPQKDEGRAVHRRVAR